MTPSEIITADANQRGIDQFHRFDFPDLSLEAFKHYGDRRINPQDCGAVKVTVYSNGTNWRAG